MEQNDHADELTTDSGIPVKRLYEATSHDRDTDVGVAGDAHLGVPGSFPFTRGVYPDMYRGRPWTMRQYAGFGTAEETNARYHYLLDRGTTGLSVAFDLPTQMGYDSDHPMAEGEVGRVGVAIDSVEDMRLLFDGIRLDTVSTSMTINSTAATLLALYVAVADEQGVPSAELSGTVQNDILKEYVARGTYIFPVEPSLRLISDVMAYCSTEIPKWNTVSISGYHMREAGSTAPQEVAFTLANGLEYVERALANGLELEDFAPRLSFFFAAHNDFFEEVAKFRAARRLWATLMRERHGASDRSCRLRFHTQTGGSTLTAQQPLNNVVRSTIQALASVLGGTQSLHTNGYDEALSLPTEESAKLALRTQQVIAHEAGVTKTVDPLGGSYYVEGLTDAVEDLAKSYIEQIDSLGGASKAIDYMQEEIHQSAYRFQMDIEAGRRTVVGLNAFQEPEDQPRIKGPEYGALEKRQKGRLQTLKTERDQGDASQAREAVRAAAASGDNLMPPIIDAVKALVSLGEIHAVLREEWGTYDP
ncbi:MAG: methylmalonyl-CoA mutase family protein [Gemmatimonadota bacterium]|nr:MAG: methylmalonyl-CoA mutase family protein [Gemmatimonadota bacterium]